MSRKSLMAERPDLRARLLLSVRHMSILDPRLAVTAALALTFASGCSDRTDLSVPSDGSVPGQGGAVTGTGGAITATGGTGAGGASAATGGAVTTGGTPAAGGNPATGGKPTGVGGATVATGGTGSGGRGLGGSGAGGSTKDAGVPRDVLCGPVCAIYCPFGNQVDSNGCPLCSCNPAPDAGPDVTCGAIDCDRYCPNGYKTDPNGCPICSCNPIDAGADTTTMDTRAADLVPIVCPTIICPDIVCVYGHATDSNGCPTCNCNPAPSVCPAIKCALDCQFGYLKDSNGCNTCKCAPDPGTPCSDLSDELTCNAAGSRCEWLFPGCGDQPIPTMGCYDTTLLDCEGTCPAGLTCLKRSINPCVNLDCMACGKDIGICL